MIQLLKEAIIVGAFVMLPFALISSQVKNTLLTVFLTGFISHLIFEYMGANKWYCKYGRACQG